jgi:translation initiation factor IF-2
MSSLFPLVHGPTARLLPHLQRLKELTSQRLVQRLHSPSSTTSSEPLDGYAPSPAARPVRQLQQAAKAQPAQRPEWLDGEPLQQRPGPGRARPAASTSSRPQWQDPDVVEDEPPPQPAAARARAQPPAALSKKPAPAPSQWHAEEPPYQPPTRAAPRQAPSPAPAPAKGLFSGLFGGGSSQPAAGLPDASAGADLPKMQCASCGRSFIESAHERHSRICEKVFVQKRKAFDMSSKRQEGLEVPAGSGGGGGRGGGRAGGAGAGRKPGVAQTRR